MWLPRSWLETEEKEARREDLKHEEAEEVEQEV